MSNFINDFINLKLSVDDIDDYISAWHNSDSELSLEEYLGMTWDEYSLFLYSYDMIPHIALSHKTGQSINPTVQQFALDALHAGDIWKYRQFKTWLEKQGIFLGEDEGVKVVG